MATIDIRDTASATLGALIDTLTNRRPLHAAIGKRAEIEHREHYLQREAEPNRNNWPKAHFWARIRKATSFVSADEGGARMTIGDPAINQKIHGGTITPKEGKYLAIAAIAEAYGHSPREFFNLKPVPIEGVGFALVERESTNITFGRKRKDGSRTVTPGRELGGRVWYWLVKSVTQRADPRALPEPAQFEAALLDECQAFFDRVRGS